MAKLMLNSTEYSGIVTGADQVTYNNTNVKDALDKLQIVTLTGTLQTTKLTVNNFAAMPAGNYVCIGYKISGSVVYNPSISVIISDGYLKTYLYNDGDGFLGKQAEFYLLKL